MLFDFYQGRFEPQVLSWARFVHDSIFEPIPLVWSRCGTWIEAWQGSKRIAFAPHARGSSLYFQSRSPVDRYRKLGGGCKTGRVSITIPLSSSFEAGLLMMVVSEELGLAKP